MGFFSLVRCIYDITIDKPFEHASSFTLLANSSINANFAKSSSQIKLSSSGGGQTSFESTFSDIGNTLLISATPDEGKIFKSWEILKSFQYQVEISNSLISPSKSVFFINSKERPGLTFFKEFTYTFYFEQGQSEQFYFSTSANSDSSKSEELLSNTTRAASNNSISF